MNHPTHPAAVRPAIPDPLYSRRRTNSIAPAVPVITTPSYRYQQPQPPPPSTLPPPPPPAPVQAWDSQSTTPISQTPTSSYGEIVLPFRPPLPWYSAPGPFPPRRRKRKTRREKPSFPGDGPASITPSRSDIPTPPTTKPPSEADSTNFATPPSTAPSSTATSTVHKPIPALPLTPPAVPSVVKGSKSGDTKAPKQKDDGRPSSVASSATTQPTTAAPPGSDPAPVPSPPANAAPAPPKSWAELVKANTSKPANGIVTPPKAKAHPNGHFGSLAEALTAFRIEQDDVISTPFLEPRGLVNTGNMCFMNSILQMLVFCGPFYFFLDRIGSGAARNFKDDTPLLEAMIMFMREFKVLRPAATKLQIKSEDLEAFGEPFAPEFVYEVIRKLKSFAHMRRGHQQDAEEFLGFLLDGLHEEAVKIMKSDDNLKNELTNGHGSDEEEDGWMEVGHKQRAAVTRTTEIQESPITRIFGGQLRSEFKVPGLNASVNMEPYTPLQLDIQAPEVKSVIDALKHLTVPEKIQGDFKSPKGPNVTATKQVSIDTLPPVLILHLKRFQYDNTGGTQKIWKKIAYPLQLDIPREALSPRRRTGSPPQYALIGVVYHHGKSASGGHYTVDVLRQDKKSWVRLDDTVIKRVRADEVAVDVKDIGSYNDFDGEEREGWVNGWEEANGSGGTNGVVKGEGGRYVGKDSKVAYILFYQRI